uniref:Uncharacterized protein n=1 Tax=Rhizophora mucronata TaxID=61149 RepID=A0A2P2NVE7_RHIMU
MLLVSMLVYISTLFLLLWWVCLCYGYGGTVCFLFI